MVIPGANQSACSRGSLGIEVAVGVVLVFVVLDVALLFWLPTLLASPRSYRFVVPGAVTLFGGR